MVSLYIRVVLKGGAPASEHANPELLYMKGQGRDFLIIWDSSV
jgi:hypothetical protein